MATKRSSTPAARSGQSRAKVETNDLYNAIRAGMDEKALMEKFGLTSKGLDRLLKKLVAQELVNQADVKPKKSRAVQERPRPQPPAPADPVEPLKNHTDEESAPASPFPSAPPRTCEKGSDSPWISAKELLACIQAGMETHALMSKFNLTENEVRRLINQLVDRGLLSREQAAAPAKPAAEELSIKHRRTGKALFKARARSVTELVELAVSSQVDLANANLRGMNLAGANLAGALLNKADLTNANLIGADLSRACLTGANFTSADMFGANLFMADLSAANLSDCNMANVCAAKAAFEGANLSESNLANADLSNANLAKADLFQAILKGTVLEGALLEETRLEFAHGI
jgi:polyhydroxyalkanoate synthesis regulator phasin